MINCNESRWCRKKITVLLTATVSLWFPAVYYLRGIYFYYMAFRKFRAKQLFDGHLLLPQDHVLITTTDGMIETILPAEAAGDDIETLDGILTPGLINCHCHLELSHLKNVIPPHTGLVEFLCSVVTKRGFAAELVQAEIEKAEQMAGQAAHTSPMPGE